MNPSNFTDAKEDFLFLFFFAHKKITNTYVFLLVVSHKKFIGILGELY